VRSGNGIHTGWKKVPGSDAAGPNGLEISEESEDKITVPFWRTGSIYTLTRLATERDIADFGRRLTPSYEVCPAPRGTRVYDAAEVLAVAFRLATTVAPQPIPPTSPRGRL
jgi:hypothetical protein